MLLLIGLIRPGGLLSHARSGLLYATFGLGFAGLSVAGAIKRDPLVVGLGVVFGVITAAIAVLAPRLAPTEAAWTEDKQGKTVDG